MIGEQQGTDKIGYPMFSGRVSDVRFFTRCKAVVHPPKNESWNKVLVLFMET